MPRFTPNPNRPEHLVSSIVALAEQTSRLALDAAMEAARADGEGHLRLVVEQVCRLAVGAGVATGEISWLVGELEVARGDGDQLSEAGVAVSGMESCMRAVAYAVQEVADRGGPHEIGASAEALRRVSAQLEILLTRLQPVV